MPFEGKKEDEAEELPADEKGLLDLETLLECLEDLDELVTDYDKTKEVCIEDVTTWMGRVEEVRDNLVYGLGLPSERRARVFALNKLRDKLEDALINGASEEEDDEVDNRPWADDDGNATVDTGPIKVVGSKVIDAEKVWSDD